MTLNFDLNQIKIAPRNMPTKYQPNFDLNQNCTKKYAKQNLI